MQHSEHHYCSTANKFLAAAPPQQQQPATVATKSTQQTRNSNNNNNNNNSEEEATRTIKTTPNFSTMGTTKNLQHQSKVELDHKLLLSKPSRQILEDLAIECAKNASQDNTFQYAFCLSKSNEKSELRYSVQILDGLVKEGYEHQIDCLYGSACALYLLGDYEKARFRAENILRSHPESRLARELHLASIESIEQEDKRKLKEAAIGGVTVAAAVGIAAGIASILLTKR